jgi:hypothetical protein
LIGASGAEINRQVKKSLYIKQIRCVYSIEYVKLKKETIRIR